MALDPRILLTGQAPQISSYGDLQQQGMTLRKMAMENQAIQNEQAERMAMKDLLRKNVSTDASGKTSINKQAALSDLYKVNPEKAMAYQKEWDAIDFENQKRITESAKKLAWSATPDTWLETRQAAIDMNLPNADKLPTEWSDGFIQKWQMATLSGEEQLKARAEQYKSLIESQKYGDSKKKTDAEIKRIEAETRKIQSETGGGKGGSNIKMTEAQSKAVGFGRRAMLADQMLEQISNDPSSDVSSLSTQIKSSLPKWLGGSKSQTEQSLNVAKTAFISSVLRKESGAAVTPSEFEQYDRIYFPQPGDSQETQNQKKLLRANFIDTEKMTAGNAWKDPVQLKAKEKPQQTFKTNQIEWAD